MRSLMTFFCFMVAIAGAFQYEAQLQAKEDGAPSGNTGAPGDEGTCTSIGCHSGAAQVRDGFITTNIPETGYIPGQVYTITISVESETRNTFGFQFSPQNDDGAKMGNLQLTDEVRTKLTGLGKYVTHTLSSLEGVDGATSWSFDWNSTGATGEVGLYAAINVANGNESATGDSIYVTSLLVNQDITASILGGNQYVFQQRLVVQNPVGEDLILQPDLVNAGAQILVYNLNGSLVLQEDYQGVPLQVAQLDPGHYIVECRDNDQVRFGRFVK